MIQTLAIAMFLLTREVGSIAVVNLPLEHILNGKSQYLKLGVPKMQTWVSSSYVLKILGLVIRLKELWVEKYQAYQQV